MLDETVSVESQDEVRDTSPLTDVEDIIASRPELTPDQWEIVQSATPWLKNTLRPDVRKELDIEYAKKYSAEMEIIRTESRKLVNSQMEEWRLAQKPLDEKEMKLLLSQEYISFDLKIQHRVNKTTQVKEFTLVELPQVQEKKFLACAQKKLVTLIEESSSFEWSMDLSTAKQIQMVLDKLPGAFDAAAELVAICLNPWDDDPEVTPEWVANYISTARMSYILITQSEVNKYRDFFSNGSRLFQNLKSR